MESAVGLPAGQTRRDLRAYSSPLCRNLILRFLWLRSFSASTAQHYSTKRVAHLLSLILRILIDSAIEKIEELLKRFPGTRENQCRPARRFPNLRAYNLAHRR